MLIDSSSLDFYVHLKRRFFTLLRYGLRNCKNQSLIGNWMLLWSLFRTNNHIKYISWPKFSFSQCWLDSGMYSSWDEAGLSHINDSSDQDQKWNWLRVWKWLPQSNVISEKFLFSSVSLPARSKTEISVLSRNLIQFLTASCSNHPKVQSGQI